MQIGNIRCTAIVIICYLSFLGSCRVIISRLCVFVRNRIRSIDFCDNFIGTLIIPHTDFCTRSHRCVDNQLGKLIFKILLDSTFERTGAKLRIVSFLGDEVLGGGSNVKRISCLLYTSDAADEY